MQTTTIMCVVVARCCFLSCRVVFVSKTPCNAYACAVIALGVGAGPRTVRGSATLTSVLSRKRASYLLSGALAGTRWPVLSLREDGCRGVCVFVFSSSTGSAADQGLPKASSCFSCCRCTLIIVALWLASIALLTIVRKQSSESRGFAPGGWGPA